ncbi:MAG TPA: polysaccharide biosynthesis C-terminal domain-containing protein [Pyrinomonadaceae bacterium]|nr:polysaccharide biosynthesis C-terminal domain-containing protein [Pyrinomonadaceae bacterium]
MSSGLINSRRFSSDVAWTLATRLLMIVNSVVAGVIVARWLGAKGVGELAVINVAVATIVQLGSFGLPSSNTYFIAQDRAHFRAATINSLFFAITIGTLLAVALTGVASLRPDWFGFVSPDLIRIAAVQIPFQLLTLIGLNILLAIGKVREFNLLDLTAQSFVLINAAVILVALNRGLDALVKLNTATSILVCVVSTALLLAAGKTLVHSNWRADAALLRRMITYGLKFHVSVLVGAIIFRADLLVVNHFRGADEAGVYSVATQFSLLLMLLPGVIATLLFPRVTSEQDASGETTWLVTKHTATIMLGCCLGAVPVSFLLPWVYGAAFANATWLLLILLPGVYLIGLESVLVQHFNALGLPRIIPVYWVVTLIVNLILVFALVPRYGAFGAAIASTISYALIFSLVAFYFQVSTRRSIMSAATARGSLRG